MAMIYQVYEIKESPGRFRICGQSDEERGTFVGLCQCEGGHESKEAAKECPTVAAKLERLFPTKGPGLSDFGWALQQLREGRRVCRPGWNGKGMWIILVKAEDWNNDFPLELGGPLGSLCLPWIGMKTAQEGFVPWLASQTDILAEDWAIAE